MISYIGNFAEDATVYIMFNTFSSNDPSASCTITNFINTDVHIHKDDGLGQRNNAAGVTVFVDFDGITGSHMIKIDTSDNTVAGFWVVGHEYFVRIEGTTIDGATINSVVGQFSIENRHNEVDVVKWLGTAAAAPTVAGVPEIDITHIGGVAQSATDLKDLVDTGYDPGNHKIQSDLIYIHGSALTETAGQLAAAFTKLFDVATPLLVASEVMRGTESAALASEYTAGRAAYLDNLSAGAVALAAGVDLTSIHGVALTETVNGYLAAAFVKLLDVSTPVLTAESVNQSANNNIILAHAEYGNAKLVRSTTPANALDVSATGEAGLDFDNIKNASGAHTLTNITVPTVTALTGKTGFSLLSTGADLILKDSTFALADAIWDAILTGATHNVATSAGRRLREVGAYAIHSGTAQAGNSVHITLAATASATDGIYNRNLLVLTDGTGASQTRTIIDYDGSTKIATIDREWRTNPDATSEYQIVADDTPLVVDQGVAQAGSTSSTIKIRAYASSTNDIYLCNIVIIVAGTGRGQARLVGAYDGTTKVITLCGDNWVTTPDDTSVYVMIPYGATCTSCVGDDALDQIDTVCGTALTNYDPPTRTEATTDKNAIITEVNGNETKIDALNDITVADIIAGIADGSYDLQEMMRIMFAALSGKSSGGGTVTLKFRDSGDAKDRISATVDATGNRTAITLDGS